MKLAVSKCCDVLLLQLIGCKYLMWMRRRTIDLHRAKTDHSLWFSLITVITHVLDVLYMNIHFVNGSAGNDTLIFICSVMVSLILASGLLDLSLFIILPGVKNCKSMTAVEKGEVASLIALLFQV